MLTPEDKERIIEEEKFRAQTRKELFGKSIEQRTARWGWLIILLIFIAFFILPLFIREFSKRSTSTQQKLRETASYPTLGRLSQADPKVVMAYSKTCGEIMRRHKERSFAIAREVIERTEDKEWYTLFKKYRVGTEKDLNMLKELNVPKGLERIHGLMVDGLQYCIEGYSATEKGDFEEGKRKAEKAADVFNSKIPPLMQGMRNE